MLLEKVYAKACGGYANLDSGDCQESLKLLTGAPTISYFCQSNISDTYLTTNYENEHIFEGLEREDEHWEILKKGFDKGSILTACSGDLSGDYTVLGLDLNCGLVPNHGYSILGVYELEISHSGQYAVRDIRDETERDNERIIKLRNPYGKSIWKGLWSNADIRWTEDLKEALGDSAKQDGVFFMLFAQFLVLFRDYQVCFYNEDYIYSAQRYNSLPSIPGVFVVDIKKPGEYYFSIHQINKKHFRIIDSKVFYKKLS